MFVCAIKEWYFQKESCVLYCSKKHPLFERRLDSINLLFMHSSSHPKYRSGCEYGDLPTRLGTALVSYRSITRQFGPRLILHVIFRFYIQNEMTESTTLIKESPVNLSRRAAEEIKNIMNTKNIPEGYNLRVGVRGGGCSGMSYILGFDTKRDHDMMFEVEDITVYMDKRYGFYLMGITIDYLDGHNGRGFTFDNPHAVQSRECGSSCSGC